MRAAAAALAFGLVVAAPAATQPRDDLQVADALVQTIGWRLSHANARHCARGAPGTGLLLGDVQTFTDPAAARAAYGLSGDVAVAAVAAGSPAAEAGLVANMVVTAVAGAPVGAAPRAGSWDRVWALQARLEQAAAQTGEVSLTLADGRVVTVRAGPSCAVRFILDDGRDNAGATRTQVRIGRKALDQLGGDEALIAALMAHELAHAVLDHETVLGPGKPTVAAVRRTEREADRLSVWLLANAGHDPEAAPRMIRLLGPHGLFVTASPTHGKASTRAREMLAEIAELRAGPDADWARRFRPERPLSPPSSPSP
jgi:hypothetical protein